MTFLPLRVFITWKRGKDNIVYKVMHVTADFRFPFLSVLRHKASLFISSSLSESHEPSLTLFNGVIICLIWLLNLFPLHIPCTAKLFDAIHDPFFFLNLPVFGFFWRSNDLELGFQSDPLMLFDLQDHYTGDLLNSETVKPGMSSLNPYAASYVPLSKRKEENKAFKITAQDPKSSDGISWSNPPFKSHQETKQNQLSGIEELLIFEDMTQKRNSVCGYHDSRSQNSCDIAEKQNAGEHFEMDLAYLSLMFPSVSDQSLADVYSENGGDLEASVDMLHQLEVYSVDVSQHLPDSLDIGDVSEFECPAEGTSVRLKNTTSGEPSRSSSVH